MAKRDDNDDDADDRASSPDEGREDESGDDGAERDGSADESEGDESDDRDADEGESADEPAPKNALARRGGDIEVGDDLAAAEGADDHAVQQMGAQRYVIAAFLVATMLGAYVLGLTVHGVWSWASNRDFFALRLPAAAAVPDESKMTYGTVFGAVVAIAYAVKQYRDPEVRTWTDDVAGELTKVKWPSQKDVTNSTIVVIAASAFAMVYLFLLDRLWGFVTGLIYGAGS